MCRRQHGPEPLPCWGQEAVKRSHVIFDWTFISTYLAVSTVNEPNVYETLIFSQRSCLAGCGCSTTLSEFQSEWPPVAGTVVSAGVFTDLPTQLLHRTLEGHRGRLQKPPSSCVQKAEAPSSSQTRHLFHTDTNVDVPGQTGQAQSLWSPPTPGLFAGTMQ